MTRRSFGPTSSACLITVFTLALLVPLPASAGKMTGSFSMTATDPGFKIGGGAETLSDQGELEGVDLRVDPETGRAAFRIDAGGVRAENNYGFGYAGMQITGILDLCFGAVEDVAVSGGRNCGINGGANEQGRMVGIAEIDLERMEMLEDAYDDPLTAGALHSVWQLSGTWQGKLVHSGSNDSYSDYHEGDGRVLGAASGAFQLYIYAHLPSDLDREHSATISSSIPPPVVYSVSRDRMLGAGDRVFEGELLSVRKGDCNGAKVSLPQNWNMFIDPGAAVQIQGLDERRPEPASTFSYYDSTIRVIKGMIRAVVRPANEDDPRRHFKFDCVVCCGGVHGTALEVSVIDGIERIACIDGQLWCEHPERDDEITLDAGEYLIATEDEVAVHTLSPADFAAAQARIDELGDPADVPPAADGGKFIYGVNQHAEKIVVHVLWHETDDTWHRVNWVIPGNSEGYLAIDGERVRADIIAHWAETEDGKLVWRRTKKQDEIDISKTEGDTYRITYRGPQ